MPSAARFRVVAGLPQLGPPLSRTSDPAAMRCSISRRCSDASGQSFTTTVPYASSYGTAEWILETPTVISTDSGVGLAAMPNLGSVPFFGAKANGANPNLDSSQAIQLVSSTGEIIATPSAPSGGDSFSVCTYSGSC